MHIDQMHERMHMKRMRIMISKTRSISRAIRYRQSARTRVRLAALLVLAGGMLNPAHAVATIHPASVVDGPANNILDVDGAAMAPDGTGGIVYRKQLEGIAHVFVAPFANGNWGTPVEVDRGDVYGASQPAIAAGAGGRLLVVWVQPRGVVSNSHAESVDVYALMGAALEPGADGFGQSIVIDPNVGEPDTGDVSGVAPRLAMAPDGNAYVVYRVVTSDCMTQGVDPPNSACPPNDPTARLVDVRVARYDYLLWSSLGAVNRAPQIAMRTPTAENAPSIGIDDLSNNGIVAWQEPDSSGVARIWVRRLFGTVQGNVLQASPETLNGRTVTSDADSPVVAVGPEGQARIAYRIQGAPGSAVTTTQLFLNSLPISVDFHGGQLGGAVPVAGAVDDHLGRPSAEVDREGAFRLTWTDNGAVDALTGSEEAVGSSIPIGSSEGQAYTTINPAGGGTTVWPATAGGAPVVGAREDYAEGAYQSAWLAGNVAGPVGGLSLGGDGQGDALLAWTQGPAGSSEVLGGFVQAPPAPFQVTTPVGWVRASSARISWEAAPDAVAGVTYSVYVDGHPRVRGLTGLATSLNPIALGDGVHRVQVLATDNSGQQTMSAASKLEVDANPPIVKVRLIDRGSGVRVTIRDSASGVDAGACGISFGDGRRARGRKTVSHRYAHPRLYTITALVRDRVGNEATVHLRVRVV
jgi:hypothetical protein